MDASPASNLHLRVRKLYPERLLPAKAVTHSLILLDIIEIDSTTEIEEIFVLYSGWKKYLLKDNATMLDIPKVKEAFYLMILMIYAKLRDY